TVAGFQDRCFRPLSHLSVLLRILAILFSLVKCQNDRLVVLCALNGVFYQKVYIFYIKKESRSPLF
ncbi:hypothetical protein L9W97_15320, partial [Vibrio aestuarianus]|uniref:hypothetical protein n=1 Tax=Vibrio aestuarianus TaxID=28171 RepID=UPI00237C68A1